MLFGRFVADLFVPVGGTVSFRSVLILSSAVTFPRRGCADIGGVSGILSHTVSSLVSGSILLALVVRGSSKL